VRQPGAVLGLEAQVEGPPAVSMRPAPPGVAEAGLSQSPWSLTHKGKPWCSPSAAAAAGTTSRRR
jgi:hypothetical protein